MVALVAALLLTINYQPSTAYSISPLEQAQNDYSFQLSKYTDTHEKYITARANYLAFKTAVAKNNAFSKTKDYFVQVHNVYLAYLFLIEERTNIFDWSFSSYKKDDFVRQIKAEADFMRESQRKAQNAQTLEEITPLALELKTHMDTKTLPVVGSVLATADLAQIQDAFYSLKQTSTNIDDFVRDKITDSNKPLYLNWKSEIDGIKSKIDAQILNAKNTLAQLTNQKTFNAQSSEIYLQTQESRNELERAKNLLAEILKFI